MGSGRYEPCCRFLLYLIGCGRNLGPSLRQGEPNFIDMWQYRLLILDVHPLFFTVAVNLLVAELSNIHNAAFLLLLESNMFHQILQGEKNKPDGFKNFLFFVFIAFIV